MTLLHHCTYKFPMGSKPVDDWKYFTYCFFTPKDVAPINNLKPFTSVNRPVDMTLSWWFLGCTEVSVSQEHFPCLKN